MAQDTVRCGDSKGVLEDWASAGSDGSNNSALLEG